MTGRGEVRIYDEAAIRAAVRLDLEAIDRIATAMATPGAVSQPPVMQIHAGPELSLCVKSAVAGAFPLFAVKLAGVNPAAAERNGIFLAIEAATMRPRAVLLENGYLTQLRTAAAGAAAARALANPAIDTLAVIGAGHQAWLQARAIALVRPFSALRVWARNAAQARDFAARATAGLGIPALACATPAEATRGAGVIVTATAATAPLLTAADLSPGQTIIAMGSDAPGKREIAEDAIRAADLYVTDSMSQCAVLGEAQGIPPAAFKRHAELGDIIGGRAAGRAVGTDTIVADLTGLGLQDTAILNLALARLGDHTAAARIGNPTLKEDI